MQARKPQPICVLLAEDCEMSRLLASAFLTRLGCEVTVARDGVEACRATEQRPFDVIFMDCEMPEMDGLDATREIRRRERASGARKSVIVALTGNGRESDREAYLGAGMDDMLQKPFKAEDLRLALLRHVLALQGET